MKKIMEKFKDYVLSHQDNLIIKRCIDLIGLENTIKCKSIDGVKRALSSSHIYCFYDKGL